MPRTLPYDLQDAFARQLLLALPRRRSSCHAFVLHDLLTFMVAMSTRGAFEQYIRSSCVTLPSDDDDDNEERSTSSPSNEQLERRGRRVSIAAASLNAPQLSAKDFLVTLSSNSALHFLRMCLAEHSAGCVDASSAESAWRELLNEVIEYFSVRRTYAYQWVVVDRCSVAQAESAVDSHHTTSATLAPPPPPAVLLVLPEDMSRRLDIAFLSGAECISGEDWTATFGIDEDRASICQLDVITQSNVDDEERNHHLMWLGTQCTPERRASRQSSTTTTKRDLKARSPNVSPIATPRSHRPTSSDQSYAPMTMMLQRPTSNQVALWYLIPSWRDDSNGTLEALDAAVSSVAERALMEWKEGGEVGVQFVSQYGENSQWVVHPSSTQLWELECVVDWAPHQHQRPHRRRFRVVRVLRNDLGEADDTNAESFLVGQSMFPSPCELSGLSPLAELYLAMARGAAAASVDVGTESHDAERPHEDESDGTLPQLLTRYDGPALQADVLCIVVPMLLDADSVIPLGRHSEPDPPVSAVVCALQLPFVDPTKFIWSSEAFHAHVTGDGGTVHSSPSFANFAESFEMFYEGCWIPMAPVNEWLLAHHQQRLFLCGAWHAFAHGVARRIRSSLDADTSAGGDDEDVIWVRRKGTNPVRMICQGVPISLDRRLLMDSTCPAILLQDDIVIVDSLLDPNEVCRTWERGDRTCIHVLEYFAIQGGASTPAQVKSRRDAQSIRSGGTQQLVEDVNGNVSLAGNKFIGKAPQPTHAQLAESALQRSAAVASLLKSSAAANYQFKFPVLPGAL